MIHLLDVNVIIALCDPAHPHHSSARGHFVTGLTRDGWATCPLVENGFLRIFGARSYPGGPGSPEVARTVLDRLQHAGGHQSWPDEVSLMDSHRFPFLPSSKHLTDLYLLGLAVKRGGCLATFDAGIDASLVPGGTAAYRLIPAG